MKKIILIIVASLIILFLSFIIWIAFNKKRASIPVLMYHKILPKEDIRSVDTDVISTDDFEKQLIYLKDHGYNTLTLDEFYCWKKKKCTIPKKSVLLTFDDGFYSDIHFTLPLLKKYDFEAAMFVITSSVPDITEEYKRHVWGLDGFDIINSDVENIEFASHSYNLHEIINNKPKVYSMSYADLDNDISQNDALLETKYLAYPYNTETNNYHKALKKHGYKLAFRGEQEKATRKHHDYQIPRIGVNSDFQHFKNIFETNKYNNKYGTGFIRKVLVTIERKLKNLF